MVRIVFDIPVIRDVINDCEVLEWRDNQAVIVVAFPFHLSKSLTEFLNCAKFIWVLQNCHSSEKSSKLAEKSLKAREFKR